MTILSQFTPVQSDALRSYIIALLSLRGVMPRVDIVFFCKQRGHTATQIGNALIRLRNEQRIFRDSVHRPNQGPDSEPAQIFWIRSNSINIEHCKDNVRQRHAIVDDTNYLETDGESYCRSLFFNVRAKARAQGEPVGFSGGITSPNKVGTIRLHHGQEGDLILRYVTRSESFGLLVENKNTFGSVTKSQVDKLIAQGIENTLMPVLLANDITRNAKDFLTYCGVPFLELGRQIIRASLRATMIALYSPEIALERFQFVAKRPLRNRPERTSKLDPRSLRDIAIISDPAWIQGSRERWIAVGDKLQTKD